MIIFSHNITLGGKLFEKVKCTLGSKYFWKKYLRSDEWFRKEKLDMYKKQ